ncbi:MAG: proteasome accessory factor PafA2 family protein, partial [Planctomycetota bacterium]|nr:proteasome accessory factor PafA2 family protein [Planctomycetota bacterium]
MRRRILGLETEYALLFRPEEGSLRPTPRKIYDALIRALEGTHITLEALYRKEGRFLSNSAFIHYEAHADAFSHGLVEAATPECRTPLDLMTYQRAIDEILQAAARDAEKRLAAEGWFGKVLIGKNSADAFGNSYGTHENYLVEDRPGPITRIILALGLTFTSIFLVSPFVLSVIVFLFALFISALVYGSVHFLLRTGATLPVIGPVFHLLDRPFRAVAQYLAGLRDDHLAKATGLVLKFGLYPAITFYSAYLSRLVLQKYKRHLTAHLISRLIFTGSGDASCTGSETGYRISQRAPFIRKVMKVYWDDANKPMFDIKQFVFEPFSAFREHKRLHILFSDSNMAEVAQYLKIGTSALIIDAIERGHTFPDLVLRSPMKALRELNRAGHAGRLETTRGESLSALQIQKRYLDGVRVSLADEEVPNETRRLLDLWATILRGVDNNPMGLERELDWVIKKRILDRLVLEESNWSQFVRWGRRPPAVRHEWCPPAEHGPGAHRGGEAIQGARGGPPR